jgi:hypothetical protein
MTELTGARLGDFEIVRKLGRGGLAVVLLSVVLAA